MASSNVIKQKCHVTINPEYKFFPEFSFFLFGVKISYSFLCLNLLFFLTLSLSPPCMVTTFFVRVFLSFQDCFFFCIITSVGNQLYITKRKTYTSIVVRNQCLRSWPYSVYNSTLHMSLSGAETFSLFIYCRFFDLRSSSHIYNRFLDWILQQFQIFVTGYSRWYVMNWILCQYAKLTISLSLVTVTPVLPHSSQVGYYRLQDGENGCVPIATICIKSILPSFISEPWYP